MVFNTLNGMRGYGDPSMRAHPSQVFVLAGMESGRMPLRKSHAAIYTAKEEAGINITAGAGAQAPARARPWIIASACALCACVRLYVLTCYRQRSCKSARSSQPLERRFPLPPLP